MLFEILNDLLLHLPPKKTSCVLAKLIEAMDIDINTESGLRDLGVSLAKSGAYL